MAVEVLTKTYVTQEEIERISYGSLGIELITDDIVGNEKDEWWREITEEATDYINQFCELRYAPEDLVDSRWVRSRATWVAAYFISQRRGNSPIFVDKFDEITDELQRVADGRIIIPRLPTREDFTPAMSNLVVHDWFQIHKLRVHPSISTGGTSSRQDLAPIFPWEWLSIGFALITASPFL